MKKVLSGIVVILLVLQFSCFLKKDRPPKQETAIVQASPEKIVEAQPEPTVDSLKKKKPLELDTNEYAPGYPLFRISAVDQLQNFPLPRYKPGHKLLPNFLWMDPNFIGNSGRQDLKRSQVIENSVVMQYELAKNFNYYLQVSPNTSVDHQHYGNPASIQHAWIKLANEHPELPVSVISFWIQMKNNRVLSKKMGDNCYMRDNDGKFITGVRDNNGVVRNGKLLSPAVPLDSLAADGVTQRGYLLKLMKHLKRPINMINEEDEIFNIYPGDVFERDPYLVEDRKRMKMNHWYPYQSEKVMNIQISYRDSFMLLPQLKNTLYTVYAVDGHETYRFHYSYMRKAGSKINGQYYPTPDFYPRYPWNWEKWRGPWHGLLWIKEARRNELPSGDSLYSPFVAPGWDRDAAKNMCPAQWLGLLKILAVTGAEFYYTGFFNEKAPFPHPESYIWQAAMPAYAQGITSRYEYIFRHGQIVNYPAFNIPAGDKRIVVMAKKMKDQELYAIAGTIQNSSNQKGDAPLAAMAEIDLKGTKLKFEVRRQGSVYIYDARNAAKPVFYQLDGWHEYSHPARWSNDLIFEAELTDKEEKGIVINTEAAEPGNYSSFTSYISFSGTKLPSAVYHFTPRDSSAVYTFSLQARSKGGKTGFRVLLDGKEIGEIGNVSVKDWKPYQLSAKLKDLGAVPHRISLVPLNSDAELDKFSLADKR